MSDLRIRISDRILSIVLAVIMLAGVIPFSEFKVSASAPVPEYKVSVFDDESSEAIDGADISYTVTVGGIEMDSGNGVVSGGSFSFTSLYSLVIGNTDGKEIILSYDITKDGYDPVHNEQMVSSTEFDYIEKMKKTAVEPVAYTLTINADNPDYGVFKIDDQETMQAEVSEGDTVTVSITAKTADDFSKRYEIAEVTVNGENQTITDASEFSADITISKDTEIEVKLVQNYYVKFSFDSEKGKVTYNEENEAENGTLIAVKKDDQLVFSALPDNNYRVSKLIIDGVEESFSENDKEISGRILSADKDHEVSVEFSLNVYSISISAYEEKDNGGTSNTNKITIDTDKEKYEYGSNATITIKISDGYYLKSFKVGDKAYTAADFSSKNEVISFVLNNITENTNINAVIKEYKTQSIDSVSWNSKDAYSNKDNVYVFQKDTKVTFKTAQLGIVLTDENGRQYGEETSQSYTFSSEVKIKKISVYSKLGLLPIYNESVVFDDSKKPLTIEYYSGPDIEITEKNKPISGIYNTNVKLKISVKTPTGNYPEIRKLSYKLSSDDEETVLYEYNSEEPSQIESSYNIEIDSKTYNSSDVGITVTAVDSKNNSSTANQSFDIDVTPPSIKVSYDNNNVSGGSDYFNQTRKATVVITERTKHFDANDATGGIVITAKDKNGRVVVNACEITGWTTVEGETPDEDTHTASVYFRSDANYTLEISYKDKAGNPNSDIDFDDSASPKKFVIDTTSPNGKIKVDQNTWDSLFSTLTFGIFGQKTISISSESSDNLSGVKEVVYYKKVFSDDLEAYSISTDEEELRLELDSLYASGNFVSEKPVFELGEKAVIYMRVMDYANNYSYISSDGVIVENIKPGISISINEKYEENSNLANGSVDFKVTVNEFSNDAIASDSAFSGINKVSYSVKNENGKTITEDTDIFNWDGGMSGMLVSNCECEFTLNPFTDEKYNADRLTVTVRAEDNSGNVVEKDYMLSINTDDVFAEISFENDAYNDKRNDDSYFTSRKGVLTISDNRAFSPENAVESLNIKATDVNGNDIVTEEGKPLYSLGEWTEESNKYCLEIVFNYDGVYTIGEYTYTNEANNKSTPIGSITFTIDSEAPTGKIKIGESAWDTLLETLTFGIFSRDNLDAQISSEDKISQTKIGYYITDETEPLDESALEDLEFTDYNGTITLQKNSRDVVYVRITDYAGNISYICSDGHIIDDADCNIELNEQDKKDIYNGEVKVDYNIEDPGVYSGIKNISYVVKCDGEITQSESIDFVPESYSFSELENTKSGTITIDPYLNNSSDVELTVTAEDNAGNVTSKSMSFDIDITVPEISVSYDNNNDNGGNGYFDKKRTATVVITERSSHFDPTVATNGISITAKDAKGNDVENAYEITEWTDTLGQTPDEDTHTAYIYYNADANYTFDISYTDNAENNNQNINVINSKAVYEFTVDTTAPEGSITAVSSEGNSVTWDKLLNTLSYSYWSNGTVKLSSVTDDKTSPVASVEYYKLKSKKGSDNTAALTVSELDRISSWQKFTGMTVNANQQFAVYLKITDNAGNYKYISTDGIIIDDTPPAESLGSPRIDVTPQQTQSGIYNSDVRISIDVEDPLVGGTYSGLRTISYRVLNMGTETQSGTLFTFTGTNPKQSDLVRNWSGTINVNSRLNNSNDVVVEVYADDNSRNSATARISLKIDVTAPTITVSYDNNSASGTYFKADRTATIVVRERNFESSCVNMQITNTDGVMPAISQWSKSGGTGNGDDTAWTATVTYSHDGDYTFGISCTDMAANRAETVQYVSGTVAATEFTIDKTIPVISVVFDNNDSKNENYYKQKRTAKITITEHNFNASDATVIVAASDDGKEFDPPVLSGWSGSGDVHTASVTFADDGLYTLDISYRDNALNNADKFTQQKFYIDNTDPTLVIKGVKDKTAYGEGQDILPAIKYSDTNIDFASASITLTGTNVEVGEAKISGKSGYYTLKNKKGTTFDWKFTITNTHNGKSVVFENFPLGEKYKDFDDIYTLSSEITDKAGRKTARSVVFSVNRFGSSYDISDIADRLGKFEKEPKDVIIREINANELSDIVITLFKNNDTIILEKDKDYSIKVSGGENEWYEYQYTIYADNFNDDGVYSIKVHSVDKAGNESENTLDTKGTQISFGIDKTAPVVVVANLKSGETYAETSKEVVVTADDNLKLSLVKVYLDGEIFAFWDSSSEEILGGKSEFRFEIAESGSKSHDLKVICQDEAGNEGIAEVKDFYITTNIFVRYFNNKPLFIGSIIALLLLIAAVVLFIKKRR